MLVLTRKSQDSIRIGDHIKVTILRIKGNTVRIGVEAPDDVRIVRGELPRFEEPAESAPNREVPHLRQSVRDISSGDKLTVSGSETDQLVDQRGVTSRMSAPMRQKPYLPSQPHDSQRSHPMDGDRLPTDISSGGAHLPLPPR